MRRYELKKNDKGHVYRALVESYRTAEEGLPKQRALPGRMEEK